MIKSENNNNKKNPTAQTIICLISGKTFIIFKVIVPQQLKLNYLKKLKAFYMKWKSMHNIKMNPI